MNKHRNIAILATALMGWSTPALAKHDGRHGHHDRHAHAKSHEPPIADRSVIIDRDGHRRILTEYFTRDSLPPGLAKRRSLPPGLEKQLRERGHLPPGLQKRLVPVPLPLASRLPAIPRRYRRYFAGRDLIIVDPRTNTVVAIVPDVVR